MAGLPPWNGAMGGILVSPAGLSDVGVGSGTGGSGISSGGGAGSLVPMIFTVDTTKAGSASNTFVLPLNPAYSYAFTVDWGDGNQQHVDATTAGFPNIPHVYSVGGTYTITIHQSRMGFPALYFANATQQFTLASGNKTLAPVGFDSGFIVDWGDGTVVTVPSSTSGFPSVSHTYAAGSLRTVRFSPIEAGNNAGDNLKIAAVTQWGDNIWLAIKNAFYGCANLTLPATDVPGVSLVADWSYAFNGCAALTSFPLLDTSRVTSIANTWNGCTGLTSFPNCNFSSVINAASAWYNCTSMTSFVSTTFGTCQSFSSTWYNCHSLTSFPAIDSHSGQLFDIAWSNCSGLTSFPAIDTHNATSMGDVWVGCSNIAGVFPTIDTSKVHWAQNMFLNCSKITGFQDTFDLRAVDSSCQNMFGNTTLLTTPPKLLFSNLIQTCYALFSGSGITSWDVTNADLSLVPILNLAFQNTKITSFPSYTLTACTAAVSMFNGCTALVTLGAQSLPNCLSINNFAQGCNHMTSCGTIDIPKCTNASYAFYDCGVLATFGGLTSSGLVANYTNAFNGCPALTSMTGVDTSSATTVSGMYGGCTALTSVPAMNLQNCTNATSVFQNCVSLSSLTITNSGGVTNWSSAFGSCSALNSYDFSTLDLHGMTNGSLMFSGVTMTTATYDAVLNKLANGAGAVPANTHNSVTFYGGNSKYDDTALTARNTYLKVTHSWTITDGGMVAPTLASISPTSGTHLGGTAVQFNGTNLKSATSAAVGGNNVTSFVATATDHVNGNTAAHAVGGPTGISATVTTLGGTATLTNAYQFT